MAIIDFIKKRKMTKRSRKNTDVRFSFDILIVLAHIAVIVYAVYMVVQIPLHTNLNFNKDEKGEITFVIDYDAEVPTNLTKEEAKSSVLYFRDLGVKAGKSLLNRQKKASQSKRPVVKAKEGEDYQSYVNPKAKEEDAEAFKVNPTLSEEISDGENTSE